MRKYRKKTNYFILLTLTSIGIFSAIGGADLLFAEEFRSTKGEPVVVAPVLSSGPVIVAPAGLTSKERSELERQYRYSVRDKASLLSPFISAGGTGTDIEGEIKSQNEQEKLYRYFGVAADLYESGKYEEAIEILRYIVEQNPDDEYVKNYLNKASEKKRLQKKNWQKTSEDGARRLKDQEIKMSLQEGIGYYKQQDFDRALLKFSDVLSVDPKNEQAKSYFVKLKQYYMKKVVVEGIVEKYDEEKNSVKLLSIEEVRLDKATNVLLDKEESGPGMYPASEKISAIAGKQPLENDNSKVRKVTEDLLDEKEIESIVMQKRLNNFMDQAELSMTVEEIIAKKKEEERKENAYTLGAGDSILISVRDHPELSGRAVVRLDGEVLLPLVNDVVKIKRLTVDEATDRLREALKRYVKDPYVSIAIEEYKSKVFYVIDEVGCTAYPVTRANLTLRDAIFVSDWGDNRALGRVVVIKPDKLHPIVRKVDAFDMIYRGNLAENIRIDNGDVIYIPLTVAAKVTKTIADTIQPFAAVRAARDEWLNLKGDVKSWKELPKVRQDLSDGYPSVWGIGNNNINNDVNIAAFQ